MWRIETLKNILQVTVAGCIILFTKTKLKSYILDYADSSEAEQIKQNTNMASGSDIELKESAGVGDLVYDEKVDHNNILPSIMDCLEFYFKEEVVEWCCEDRSKIPEKPRTTRMQTVASIDEKASVVRDQTELTDRRKQIKANSAHQY
uniref:Uncharacterized protein n=1 Tax=Arundo donax TaxID=35708 RepID=A0A0A8ZRC0_ARUDO